MTHNTCKDCVASARQTLVFARQSRISWQGKSNEFPAWWLTLTASHRRDALQCHLNASHAPRDIGAMPDTDGHYRPVYVGSVPLDQFV